MTQTTNEPDRPSGKSVNSTDPANPYGTPPATESATTAEPKTLWFGAGIVFASSIVCGLIGMGIGVLLGVVAPGYYRSVFSGGSTPEFDPVQVGLGLGLTQGVLFGGVIGLVLVAVYYWYKIRLAQIAQN